MSAPVETTGRPYRFCLMGAAFDTGNMGVSALAASVATLVLEQRPGAQISLFVGNREGGERVQSLGRQTTRVRMINLRWAPRRLFHEEHAMALLAGALVCRLSPFAGLRRAVLNASGRLRALSECDAIGDIRGGDSFSDIYGLSAFLTGCLPGLVVVLLGKEWVLLPQTYGPYRTGLARRLAGFLIRRARRVYSRDRAGLEVAAATGGAGAAAQFCPDVAFALEPVAPERWAIEPPLEERRSRPLAGLNVSGLLYNGGFTQDNMFGLKLDYKRFVERLGRQFLEAGASLLLVPHTFAPPGAVESDNDACRRVAEALAPEFPGRVHLAAGDYDQHQIKAVIGQCDFFVGARMHACVAALSQGVPAAGVAYSRKFAGVFESVGMGGEVLDARACGEEEALERVAASYARREAARAALAAGLQTVRAQLRRVFSDITGGGARA